MKSCHIVVLAGFLLTGSQAVAQPAPHRLHARVGSGPAETVRLRDAPHYFGRPHAAATTTSATCRPARRWCLAEIDGPGCIVHFRDNITSSEPHHLQYHVLRMYWDGETDAERGSARAATSSASASASPRNTASALMCIDDRRGPTNTDPAASGAARNCYIPMPFAKSAKITITNEGKQPSPHWFEVNCKIFDKPQENVGYFHAQYRQGTPPPEGPYLILDAKGRGHLVGCVLSVKNNDGGWWGEGDEIVEIDGKHAIQGTGSEDYFCESYGLREGCFPYFGVTVDNDRFYHGLSLAHPGPGAVQAIHPLSDRAGQRQPALQQRQLLL